MIDLEEIRRDPAAWARAQIERIDARRPRHGALTADEALSDVEDLLTAVVAITTAHDNLDPVAAAQARLAGAAHMRLDGLREALGIEHRGTGTSPPVPAGRDHPVDSQEEP